jgi:hypothetical protein
VLIASAFELQHELDEAQQRAKTPFISRDDLPAGSFGAVRLHGT